MNKKPLNKNKVINILNKIKLENLESEILDLLDAENRILSESVISSINLPPFKNSAVDGYAVHDENIGKNSKLKIAYRIVAGDNKQVILSKGEVARIFTGAKMPTNSNTVVMQENIIEHKGIIEINKNPKKGDNCRLAGEDVKKNDKVFKKGQKINSTNLSLLAAIGKNSINVKKKLMVGYFTSGNELQNPSEKLIGSQINNSNKYTLNTLLKKNYINANYLGTLKDSKDKIIKSLMKSITKYSVIITMGGASVGEEDHLINVIKQKGNLFFWKVAIKPGRPFAIGKINNTLIICLPGNPVSVYLLYGMFIKSFLEKLCGSIDCRQSYLMATVNFSMRKKTNRLEWLRVSIDNNYKNKIHVNKFPKQGSGIISSIAFSDGIIEIPENISKINKGDKYKLYLFKDLFE